MLNPMAEGARRYTDGPERRAFQEGAQYARCYFARQVLERAGEVRRAQIPWEMFWNWLERISMFDTRKRGEW
jgi:hypothetical protein